MGDLTDSAGAVVKPTVANVKFSDRPSANAKYDPFKIDEKLQGVVATYDADIPRGECTLDISGADNVDVYYKPYVNIAVSLEDANGIGYTLMPGEDNVLSAGDYDVAYAFLDPFTGDELDSSLLYPATFKTKVESGGNVSTSTGDEKLHIPVGTVNIVSTAETKGGAKASQSYRGVQVSPAITPMQIDLSAIPTTIDVASIGSQSWPVTVTKDDGTALSAQEWGALEFSLTDERGIEWKAERSDQPGTLQVAPQQVDGDSWATQEKACGSTAYTPRQTRLSAAADSTVGETHYKAMAQKDVSYAPNVLDTFVHMLPFLIGLLIFLFFAYKFITKPRLPRKMKPKLLTNGKNEKPLAYSDRKISNRYSPFGPERVTFAIATTDGKRFGRQVPFSSIGLVAAKRKNGKRRFYLDAPTAALMKKLEERPPKGFPAPKFAPPPPTYEGRNKDRPKKKSSSHGASWSLSFNGKSKPMPGMEDEVRTVKYTIKFK